MQHIHTTLSTFFHIDSVQKHHLMRSAKHLSNIVQVLRNNNQLYQLNFLQLAIHNKTPFKFF